MEFSDPLPRREEVRGAVALVGDGRCARHLRAYLDSLGIATRQWSRRRSAEGKGRWKDLEGCAVVWVAISDDALEGFVRENRFRLPEALWLHASGALEVEGARTLHPLMTFAGDPYADEAYRQMALVTTSPVETIRRFLPGLPNSMYRIEPADKARYHALAVVGGNFGTLLWHQALVGMAELGLPSEAIWPYARRILANLESDPGQALTGPLSRADWGTIGKNLEALRGTRLEKIYRAFVESFT